MLRFGEVALNSQPRLISDTDCPSLGALLCGIFCPQPAERS